MSAPPPGPAVRHGRTDDAEPVDDTAADATTVSWTRVEPGEAVRANRSWWDANAAEYYVEHGDFLGDGQLVWGPEGWTEEQLGLLGDVAAVDVLEVGAGAAQGARHLQGLGARVVACDLSAGMLATAARIDARRREGDDARRRERDDARRRERDDAGPERAARPVPLVQCDGRLLPFAAASFDVVFTAYGVLPFITDGQRFFEEAARVLRPGGRLVAAEPHPIRWCFPDEPDHRGLTVTMPYWDRRAYTERDGDGDLGYAESHVTIESRLAQIVGSGLRLTGIREPTWPEHNAATWGGWSPLRGEYLPGTIIWLAARDG